MKVDLSSIMNERDILTGAWNILKENVGIQYQPDTMETSLKWLDLFAKTQKLYDLGKTPAQKVLSQKLALALGEYYTTLCEEVENNGQRTG